MGKENNNTGMRFGSILIIGICILLLGIGAFFVLDLSERPEDQTTVVAGEDIPIGTLTITNKDIHIPVGKQELLGVTVSPQDATELLNWSSSDSTIASVDKNGLVQAIAPGTAVVTAISIASEVSAKTDITVVEETSSNP